MQITLEHVLSYKSVYALTTVVAKKGSDRDRLKATHYAVCLVNGRVPLWGVWTVGGRFQRFFKSRQEIADEYPKLVWRRKMASWNLRDVADKTVELRVEELEDFYGKKTGRDRQSTKSKEAQSS